MERMIINLKKEIKMLRDKLLSTGVILEPSLNIKENESMLEST
jgi:hypothetical protein